MTIPRKTKGIELGTVLGEWTVLAYAGVKGSGGNSYWLCRCSCGNEKEVMGTPLRLGRTTMCQRCAGRGNGRKGLNAMAKSHLYVIRCGEYFKVGSSDNPERRIRDLESSCPYPITTEAIYLNRGHEEARWHELLRDQHHHGEWFVGSCEVL